MAGLRDGVHRAARWAMDALPQRVHDRALRAIVARASDRARRASGVVDAGSALGHLRDRGHRPDAILDIGAFDGRWASLASEYFPHLPTLLVEGDPAHDAELRAQAERLRPARSRIALLGAEAGREVDFYQHGTGSSVFEELTRFDKVVARRTIERLDDVADRFFDEVRISPERLLVKLDVQGYELEVLRGGRRTLERTAALILEVSLMQYNRGAPLFREVVDWLEDSGFVAYDVCQLHHRDTDGALFQVDVVCVPAASLLRSGRFWRAELDLVN